MKKLNVAASLALPVEALTQTFAVLGKRGTGKTSFGVVLVEEFVRAGLPVTVIDPVGVWWGLRSSRDGKAPGLPVFILGGEHGEVPLEPTSGAVVADLVVESDRPFVLDLSSMRKGGMIHFMRDFCERVYEAKAKNRSPLHLMFDEADTFVPQQQRGEGGHLPSLIGAMEDLVRRGRSRGLGMTLISQRPAVLNKNVLTQAEVLAVFQLTAPQDRAAIDDWVRANAKEGEREKFEREVPELPVGTAFLWSPAWLKLFKRVPMRQRDTFDSSATPTVGVATKAPKKLAPVDTEWLRKKIASTVDMAKSEDPKTLRTKIAELEAKVRALALDKTEPVTVTVEKPVLEKAVADALASFVDDLGPLVANMKAIADGVQTSLAKLAAAPAPPAVHAPRPPRTSPFAMPPIGRDHVARPIEDLGKCAMAMLNALACRTDRRTTRAQLAGMTGYSVGSGSFAQALGRLRSMGLVTGSGDDIRASDEGAKLAPNPEPTPTGGHLIHAWMGRLGKAEGQILSAAWDAHLQRRSLSRDELAKATGYSAQSGSFAQAIGRLRSLELVAKGSLALGRALLEEA